jgi:hypothetical protein
VPGAVVLGAGIVVQVGGPDDPHHLAIDDDIEWRGRDRSHRRAAGRPVDPDEAACRRRCHQQLLARECEGGRRRQVAVGWGQLPGEQLDHPAVDGVELGHDRHHVIGHEAPPGADRQHGRPQPPLSVHGPRT